MHRNHVWISTLRRLLISQVFALFVCAPVVWGQSFGTNVTGAATACGQTNKYSQDGDKSSVGETQAGPCKTGLAAASSTANLDIDVPEVGAASAHGGSARAASLTYDTLTLIPPSTFHEKSVTFSLLDSYDYKSGGNGSGSVRTCWLWNLPAPTRSCATHTGSGSQKVKIPITLNKTNSGFQTDISKLMQAQGSAPGKTAVSIAYKTWGLPNFALPKGWTCAFASGYPCP